MDEITWRARLAKRLEEEYGFPADFAKDTAEQVERTPGDDDPETAADDELSYWDY